MTKWKSSRLLLSTTIFLAEQTVKFVSMIGISCCRRCYGDISGIKITGSGGYRPHNYIWESLHDSSHKKCLAFGMQESFILLSLQMVT